MRAWVSSRIRSWLPEMMARCRPRYSPYGNPPAGISTRTAAGSSPASNLRTPLSISRTSTSRRQSGGTKLDGCSSSQAASLGMRSEYISNAAGMVSISRSCNAGVRHSERYSAKYASRTRPGGGTSCRWSACRFMLTKSSSAASRRRAAPSSSFAAPQAPRMADVTAATYGSGAPPPRSHAAASSTDASALRGSSGRPTRCSRAAVATTAASTLGTPDATNSSAIKATRRATGNPWASGCVAYIPSRDASRRCRSGV